MSDSISVEITQPEVNVSITQPQVNVTFPNQAIAQFFSGLGDVDFTNLQNGQIPVYNFTTGKRENSTDSGPVLSVFGRVGVVGSVNGDYTASQITNAPSGNLEAITVQGALNELQTEIDNITHTVPAGLDTEVQFNDGGVFGGDSNFTFRKSDAQLKAKKFVSSEGQFEIKRGLTFIAFSVADTIGIGTTSVVGTKMAINGSTNGGAGNILVLRDSLAVEQFRFTDEGFLGLGTNNPTEKLYVAGGNILFENGYALRSEISSVVTNVFTTSGTTMIVGSGNRQLIRFDVGGASNRMIIDNVGNVGIGEASPSSLDRLTVKSLSNGGATNILVGEDSLGAEQFRFTDKGWLGLGTNTPLYPIHIADSDHTRRIAITEGQDTSQGSFLFGDTVGGAGFTPGFTGVSSVSDIGLIFITRPVTGITGFSDSALVQKISNNVAGSLTTGKAWVFRNGPNDLLTLEVGGDFGIGESSPGARLDIKASTNGGGGNIMIGQDSLGAEQFRFTDDSKLGIGDNNPANSISVEVATATLHLQSTTGNNATYLRLQNSGGKAYLARESSVGGGLLTGSSPYSLILTALGVNPMHFGVNNSVAMTIINGGDIGIGENSPSARLDIKASTNGGAGNILIGQDSLGATQFTFDDQGTQDLGGVATLNLDSATTATPIIKLGSSAGDIARIITQTGGNRLKFQIDSSGWQDSATFYATYVQMRDVLGIPTNDRFNIGLSTNQDEPYIRFHEKDSSGNEGYLELGYGSDTAVSDLDSFAKFNYLKSDGTRVITFNIDKGGHVDVPLGASAGYYFGGYDTGFYAPNQYIFRFTINGTPKRDVDGDRITAITTVGPSMLHEVTTNTNPVFIPYNSDTDTGLGGDGADTLSLIAGGVEGLRIDEATAPGFAKTIINPDGAVGANTGLRFGDGDTGFYESFDDTMIFRMGGTDSWNWSKSSLQVNGYSGPRLQRTTATITIPTLIPASGDTNTGIGASGNDQLSLIAGGVEGLRIDESTAPGFARTRLNPDGAIGVNTGIYFGDGDTGFYENADDSLVLKLGNVNSFQFYLNAGNYIIGGYSGGSPAMRNIASTATVPNLHPKYTDLNTGIGSAGNDMLSLIAGGTEIMRLVRTTATYAEHKGGTRKPITTKVSSTYTITLSDSTIILDGSSNIVTATLPTAVGNAGQIFNVKCINITNTCTLECDGIETIDGNNDIILALYDSITVQSNGTARFIL